MKNKILLFIAIIGLSFSKGLVKTKEYSGVKDKVLLIFYTGESNIKIIKDYKNISKRFQYMPSNPPPYPSYDYDNKTLELHEEIKLTDSSKIIFCGYNEVFDISLPFHFEDITLDSLINDSTMRFTFNNQKHIIKPGEAYIDTLVSILKEGKRVIERTTIFHVANYGLIFKNNIRRFKVDTVPNSFYTITDSSEIELMKQLDEKK